MPLHLARWLLAWMIASAALATTAPLTWQSWQRVPAVFDLAGPRNDGRLVAAAGGRLLRASARPPGDRRRGGSRALVPRGPQDAARPVAALAGFRQSHAEHRLEVVLRVDLEGNVCVRLHNAWYLRQP